MALLDAFQDDPGSKDSGALVEAACAMGDALIERAIRDSDEVGYL